MSLIDTDVFIRNVRGDPGAAELLDGQSEPCLSAVTYMELVQGLRDKDELTALRQALAWWDARIVQQT